MATEGYKRKISATLSADVAGYCCLMVENETAMLSTLETCRETIAIIIEQHRGRIIDSPGDKRISGKCPTKFTILPTGKWNENIPKCSTIRVY